MQVTWHTAREMVSVLRKMKKVYGTYTPRKINGVNAEYSMIVVDDNGQHWHFFTSDFRWSHSATAVVRKTSGPKDFGGETNMMVQSAEQLKRIMGVSV